MACLSDRPNHSATMTLASSDQSIIDTVRRWLERAVIGLNLCPFAKAVHVRGQIRFVVSQARDTAALSADLQRELLALADDANAAPAAETTILIHPWCLADFLDYNDYLDQADQLLYALSLDGVLQIASFHPDYQFAGTDRDDIDNYTNRAPFPILHLLRESSIDRAVESYPDTAEIYQRNIETLRVLGKAGWARLELVPQSDGDGADPAQ